MANSKRLYVVHYLDVTKGLTRLDHSRKIRPSKLIKNVQKLRALDAHSLKLGPLIG